MTRSGTVEVLQTDYVRTAHLKGLSTSRVLFSHVLRNSLPPHGDRHRRRRRLAHGRSDNHRSYPGLGRLVLYAVQRRDLPLIQSTTMLIVAIFALANLAADIIYALLNPRIRYR